jgi:hypothetical protein
VKDAFLSYYRFDERRIALLYEALVAAGVDVFWDRKDITPGDPERETIEQGVRNSRCLVVAVTHGASKRVWIDREIGMAQNQKLRIIPVRLAPDVELPKGLDEYSPVVLTDWQGGTHQELDRLIDRIRRSSSDTRSTTETSAPGQKAGPTARTTHIHHYIVTTADGRLSAMIFQDREARGQPPATAEPTPLAEIQQAVDRHDVVRCRRLLRGLLFGAELLPQDHPADNTAGWEHRLCIHCRDTAAAALPWHWVAAPPQPRGGTDGSEQRTAADRPPPPRWVVEVIIDFAQIPVPEATRSLDSALIIAPTAPELQYTIDMHASQFKESVRPLLLNPFVHIEWLKSPRDTDGPSVDRLCAEPPDLVYLHAPVGPTVDGEPSIVLASDGIEDYRPVPLSAIGALLARFAQRPPILWLHLIESEPLNVETVLQTLVPASRLTQLTLCTQADLDAARRRTLEALRRFDQGEQDPAAVFGQTGGERSRLWLCGQRTRIQTARNNSGAHLRARVRAALVRVMLGREVEKERIDGAQRALRPPRKPILLFGVVGDAESAVHDFPTQVRRHIHINDQNQRRNAFDPTVVTSVSFHQRIEVPAAPVPPVLPFDPVDGLIRRIKNELGVHAGYLMSEAIRNTAPPSGPSIIIFDWLIRPEPRVSDDRLVEWLDAWKRANAALFGADELELNHRVLICACIQCPPDWDRPRIDGLQTRVDDAITRQPERGSGARLKALAFGKGLGTLDLSDLETFYADGDLNHTELALGSRDPYAIAHFVHGRTGGRFEATVDLICTEVRDRYVEFDARPTGVN